MLVLPSPAKLKGVVPKMATPSDIVSACNKAFRRASLELAFWKFSVGIKREASAKLVPAGFKQEDDDKATEREEVIDDLRLLQSHKSRRKNSQS